MLEYASTESSASFDTICVYVLDADTDFEQLDDIAAAKKLKVRGKWSCASFGPSFVVSRESRVPHDSIIVVLTF